MKNHRPIIALLLVSLISVGVAGCSDGNAKLVTAPTADQAIEQTARSIADGRFDAAWQALPPSYREDVTQIVHQSASEMDAELWKRTFTVLQKTTRILSEKRDFILDHPMLASNIENRSEAEAGWDSVVGLFNVVVNSDLSDLNKMQHLDVEKFLGQTGKALWTELGQASKLTPDNAFEKSMNDLRTTQATVLSVEGQKARVLIEVPGKPPREDDYLLVEGRWIPAELANGWGKMIDETRQKLAQLSGEEGAPNRQAALMQLGMIESMLDTLQAAKTAEEFQAGLGAAMGAVMGSAMSMANQAPQNTTEYTPGP